MADFDYTFPLPEQDPACESSFERTFEHQDWVDGQDVVQAQKTPDEMGFNERLHRIEHDLDQLGQNLNVAFECIARLRQQLVQVLAEIKQEFNRPPDKTSKESKDTKDIKDGKDVKDIKDGKEFKDVKDVKDAKDAKDGKDAKDVKDAKDAKDGKDSKDTKDTKDGKDGKDGKDDKDSKDDKDDKDDKDGKESPDKLLKEKEIPPGGHIERVEPLIMIDPRSNSLLSFLFGGEEAPAGAEPLGRAFIRSEERPTVGARVLQQSEQASPEQAEELP